jgi:hypothetical protein
MHLAIVSTAETGKVTRRRFPTYDEATAWVCRETLGELVILRHYVPVYDSWWVSARCKPQSRYRWEIFPESVPAESNRR